MSEVKSKTAIRLTPTGRKAMQWPVEIGLKAKLK